MPRILVYSGTKFKSMGSQRKLEGIDFAEICEADQFEEVFERASKVNPLVSVLQLEDPTKLARVAAYGLAGIFNEPK